MNLLDVSTQHSEAIVCCSAPNTDNIIASGCEGGLVCFSSFGSHECIGSIDFGSSNVCTSVQCSEKDAWSFFCSVGSHIHCIDIRKGLEPSCICNTFQCGDDEINSISLSSSEKWLAAGDDEGEVHCFNLTDMGDSVQKRPDRILRRGHQNICSSVIFSKIDENQILSGGLDCLMIRWNVQKLKTSKIWTMPNITTSGQRALNPPMVHDIDTCLQEDGKKEIVAVARGDGSVAMYDALAKSQTVPRSKKQPARNQLANPDSLVWMAFPEDKCHTSACNAVRFTSHGAKRLLLSAGNDAYLKLWDWNEDTALVSQVSNGAKINCIAGLHSQQGPHDLGIIGDVKGNLRIVTALDQNSG